MYRGRFAPSPTGDLHTGSAACALLAWLRARSLGGALVMRVEDIDFPRVEEHAEERQLGDLRWLGLDWDEGPDVGGPHGPYRQSARLPRYQEALDDLARQGLTYYCDCSRADITRVASAPHEGEEGPRYPGTCRSFGMAGRAFKRPPAIRLKVPDVDVAVTDALQGSFVENVHRAVGDFVLRRGDGIFAYQLAVVVDDLEMAVTEVVRGADLLGSTARQMLLAKLLGKTPPQYAHHPMVLAPDGSRLAKRKGSRSIAEYRRSGTRADALVAAIVGALGLSVESIEPRDAITPRDLIGSFDWSALKGRDAVRL